MKTREWAVRGFASHYDCDPRARLGSRLPIPTTSDRLSVMKKLLLLAAVLLVSQSAFAVETESSGPLRKLQRGFVNIALSPMEISTELAKEKNDNADQMLPSWMSGSVRGVAFMGGRALAGVYDIVTFPIPLPKEYGPLVQPEFPWEHLPKK